MACQKVCKQGRDDIIVKVNLQSPIPTSFYITVANWCENDAGMRLCKFTFTIISSLPGIESATGPWGIIAVASFKSYAALIMCSKGLFRAQLALQ